ncbi:protein transport protein SEC16B [Pelomyxa schiedti]|nr:protein transport protein SEC16B [Pelomyxa schiedti]
MLLTVHVVEATGVPARSGGESRSLYCRVIMGRDTNRTPSARKLHDPKWNHVCGFVVGGGPVANVGLGIGMSGGSCCPTGECLRFKLVDSSGLIDETLSKLSVSLQDIPRDTVHKMHLAMVPVAKKKETTVTSMGELYVICYLSDMADKPTKWKADSFQFSYPMFKSKFKPGDIILFSGAGPVPTLAKMISGMPFSHVGLIVSLPNKWTREPELYLFELTRNTERFVDAYHEKPTAHLPAIYRFYERLHGFYGTEIWWCPLKAPLAAANISRMIEWVLNAHSDAKLKCVDKDPRHVLIDFRAIDWTPSHLQYMEYCEVEARYKNSYSELFSAEMCAKCLKQAGLDIPSKHFTAPHTFLESNLFENPILLRARPDIYKQALDQGLIPVPPKEISPIELITQELKRCQTLLAESESKREMAERMRQPQMPGGFPPGQPVYYYEQMPQPRDSFAYPPGSGMPMAPGQPIPQYPPYATMHMGYGSPPPQNQPMRPPPQQMFPVNGAFPPQPNQDLPLAVPISTVSTQPDGTPQSCTPQSSTPQVVPSPEAPRTPEFQLPLAEPLVEPLVEPKANVEAEPVKPAPQHKDLSCLGRLPSKKNCRPDTIRPVRNLEEGDTPASNSPDDTSNGETRKTLESSSDKDEDRGSNGKGEHHHHNSGNHHHSKHLLHTKKRHSSANVGLKDIADEHTSQASEQASVSETSSNRSGRSHKNSSDSDGADGEDFFSSLGSGDADDGEAEDDGPLPFLSAPPAAPAPAAARPSTAVATNTTKAVGTTTATTSSTIQVLQQHKQQQQQPPLVVQHNESLWAKPQPTASILTPKHQQQQQPKPVSTLAPTSTSTSGSSVFSPAITNSGMSASASASARNTKPPASPSQVTSPAKPFSFAAAPPPSLWGGPGRDDQDDGDGEGEGEEGAEEGGSIPFFGEPSSSGLGGDDPFGNYGNSPAMSVLTPTPTPTPTQTQTQTSTGNKQTVGTRAIPAKDKVPDPFSAIQEQSIPFGEEKDNFFDALSTHQSTVPVAQTNPTSAPRNSPVFPSDPFSPITTKPLPQTVPNQAPASSQRTTNTQLLPLTTSSQSGQLLVPKPTPLPTAVPVKPQLLTAPPQPLLSLQLPSATQGSNIQKPVNLPIPSSTFQSPQLLSGSSISSVPSTTPKVLVPPPTSANRVATLIPSPPLKNLGDNSNQSIVQPKPNSTQTMKVLVPSPTPSTAQQPSLLPASQSVVVSTLPIPSSTPTGLPVLPTTLSPINQNTTSEIAPRPRPINIPILPAVLPTVSTPKSTFLVKSSPVPILQVSAASQTSAVLPATPLPTAPLPTVPLPSTSLPTLVSPGATLPAVQLPVVPLPTTTTPLPTLPLPTVIPAAKVLSLQPTRVQLPTTTPVPLPKGNIVPLPKASLLPHPLTNPTNLTPSFTYSADPASLHNILPINTNNPEISTNDNTQADVVPVAPTFIPVPSTTDQCVLSNSKPTPASDVLVLSPITTLKPNTRSHETSSETRNLEVHQVSKPDTEIQAIPMPPVALPGISVTSAPLKLCPVTSVPVNPPQINQLPNPLPIPGTSNLIAETGVQPGCVARFGFGGLLATAYSHPQNEPPYSVHVVNLKTALTSETREFTDFPGPLNRSISQDVVLKFLALKHQEATPICEFETQPQDRVDILWSLLQILIRHYGNIAYETNNKGPTCTQEIQQLLLSSLSKHITTPKPVSVRPNIDPSAFAHFQSLLLEGKKTEAYKYAINEQLWEHALILSHQFPANMQMEAIKQYAQRALPPGDPIRTLYLLLAALPTEIFSAVPNGYDTSPIPLLDRWRENLAVVLANNKMNTDRGVIGELGDRLWTVRGNVVSAHFCYCIADYAFGFCDNPNTRLVLLGADHKRKSQWITPQAIQATEVYEYSKLLGNPQFNLPSLHVFKFIYAQWLADLGLVDLATKYVRTVTSVKLSQMPHNRPNSIFSHYLGVFSERLKAHTTSDSNSSAWKKVFSFIKYIPGLGYFSNADSQIPPATSVKFDKGPELTSETVAHQYTDEPNAENETSEENSTGEEDTSVQTETTPQEPETPKPSSFGGPTPSVEESTISPTSIFTQKKQNDWEEKVGETNENQSTRFATERNQSQNAEQREPTKVPTTSQPGTPLHSRPPSKDAETSKRKSQSSSGSSSKKGWMSIPSFGLFKSPPKMLLPEDTHESEDLVWDEQSHRWVSKSGKKEDTEPSLLMEQLLATAKAAEGKVDTTKQEPSEEVQTPSFTGSLLEGHQTESAKFAPNATTENKPVEGQQLMESQEVPKKRAEPLTEPDTTTQTTPTFQSETPAPSLLTPLKTQPPRCLSSPLPTNPLPTNVLLSSLSPPLPEQSKATGAASVLLKSKFLITSMPQQNSSLPPARKRGSRYLDPLTQKVVQVKPLGAAAPSSAPSLLSASTPSLPTFKSMLIPKMVVNTKATSASTAEEKPNSSGLDNPEDSAPTFTPFAPAPSSFTPQEPPDTTTQTTSSTKTAQQDQQQRPSWKSNLMLSSAQDNDSVL